MATERCRFGIPVPDDGPCPACGEFAGGTCGLAHKGTPAAFQDAVALWMDKCFGEEIASDRTERNHRFLEESLELGQACGLTQDEAHQLVDYVYGRPAGERYQEVGGVMVTLAALCNAHALDLDSCGQMELDRVWLRIDKIRAKHAAKTIRSPLPGPDPQGDYLVIPRELRRGDD